MEIFIRWINNNEFILIDIIELLKDWSHQEQIKGSAFISHLAWSWENVLRRIQTCLFMKIYSPKATQKIKKEDTLDFPMLKHNKPYNLQIMRLTKLILIQSEFLKDWSVIRNRFPLSCLMSLIFYHNFSITSKYF